MASVHITKINAVQENIKVFVQNVAFLQLLPLKTPGAASVKTGSYFLLRGTYIVVHWKSDMPQEVSNGATTSCI